MGIFGHVILVMGNFCTCDFWYGMMGYTFVLQSLKSQGSLQMLKSKWEALSPDIRNIINNVGFGTYFEALLY